MNKTELGTMLRRFPHYGGMETRKLRLGPENMKKLVEDGYVEYQAAEDFPYSLTTLGQKTRDEFTVKLAGTKAIAILTAVARSQGDYSYLAATDQTIESCRKLKDLGLMSGGKPAGGLNKRTFSLTDEGKRLGFSLI